MASTNENTPPSDDAPLSTRPSRYYALQICLECGMCRYTEPETPCTHAWDNTKAKYTCDTCGWKTNHKAGLEKHKTHDHGKGNGALPDGNGIYHCEHCPRKEFKSFAGISNHNRFKHDAENVLKMKAAPDAEALEKLYEQYPTLPPQEGDSSQFMPAYHRMMIESDPQ